MRYEFKQEDAFRFKSFIGTDAKTNNGELVFRRCPYCNSDKVTNSYRFSINLSTGQFECKRASCGAKGNMITLAKDFGFSLGNDYDRYVSRDDDRRFKKPVKKDIVVKDGAVQFLQSRGIGKDVAEKYKITTMKDKDNIVIFPFLDQEGNLVTAKYRKADFDKEKDSNKEWFEKGCKPILFGMYQCNLENKTLIITEGQIDSLSIAYAGIENAVSVPNGAKGFTWIPYCWDWLQNFEKLIVFGDFEKGAMTLLPELSKRFKGEVFAVREEDYQGCKDANEILIKYGTDAIRNAINNAERVPIRRIKDLSEVKAVDIYSIPKIKSGIQSLDRLLYGGFAEGQVILITGKRGKGKSTLASNFLASALRQGKKVLAYSGELQDFFFKRWLDLQIAGSNHINERFDELGNQKFFITNTNIDKINDWYRDRAFIYDNNIVEDDEPEDLMKTIEETVRQYGIDMILIDNLMTSIDLDSNDVYKAQSKFVNNLCKIAKAYNIVVLLVAHPRKNSGGIDENDEVAGSADITNRVDVVMTYKSDNDLPEDERLLSVSKNRLTGKLTDGITLFYDQKSKRINDQREFNEDYGIFGDGFEEIQGQIPFTF